MKGIRQRYPGSFSIIIELGYEVDPATGKRTRRQRWVTFRGTRKEAEAKRIELLAAVNTGTFAEPSKVTLIEWLRTWLKTSVAPPMRRPATHRVYASIIEKHIAPSRIALIPLQRLRGTDLERYLADVPGAAASVAVHHAISAGRCAGRSTLGNARFVELVAKAGVKRIKFHGLRHTCATLLLQAGTPVHVVARRLGHANVGMTLNVYAHATRGMQEDAAARLGALLHG